jgi:hypothetical protein
VWGDEMDDGKNSFTPQINYELLVEEALRSVVRSSLRIAEESGLPGETHFFITFLTTHPGVIIPDRLRESHPEKMTIIIQHQFWDLKTDPQEFSVTLSFGGNRETLTVPYLAIIDFSDPSVGFGLQFSHDDPIADNEGLEDEGIDATSTEDDNQSGADVVLLDTFRNKP